MKKWHIMLILGVLGVGIFTMLGIVIYKYYIVPRHIEPIVEKIDEYVTQDDILDELYYELSGVKGVRYDKAPSSPNMKAINKHTYTKKQIKKSYYLRINNY